MKNQISKVWTFASDSNPNLEYETLQFADGSTSCNCKGWTRRMAADGNRSCKHTSYVDMGTADAHCTATHRYQTENHQPIYHDKNHVLLFPKLGHRKFAV